MFTAVIGFFQKRPIAILYTVIALAVVAGVWHYRGLVNERDRLEGEVATLELNVEKLEGAIDLQKNTIEAVQTRSKEIADAFAAYELTLADLERTSRDLRQRNAQLAQQIADLDLEQVIVEDPGGAGDTASDFYNDLVRLRNCRTNPDTDGTCSLTTDSTTDTAAPEPASTD